MKILSKKESVPMDPNEMNLSLNGCGYLGIYHVGACSCIRKYYPQALKGKISGGSVGALVAAAFMCEVPLDICAKYVFDVSMKVRNGILGPMTPDLNIMKVLYDSMDAMLPQDAHLRCDGRLHVSVTRFDDGKNVLLNKFKTREDVLQALMCSCFIPVYCGYEPPEFYGVAYVDAALSNNSPWLNRYTVAVAPFSGNSDICPENDGLFLKSLTLSNTSIGLTTQNMYMLFRVLFPASPDIQKDICQRGYNDALRFLRDKGLLQCFNCVDRNTTYNHASCPTPEDMMPEEIFKEIEKAIIDFKKDLRYRLMQFKSMKILYYLNMPSIVTAKFAYTVMSTLLQKVQSKAGFSVDDIWCKFLHVLSRGLYNSNRRRSLSDEGSELTQRENDSCYTSYNPSEASSSGDETEYMSPVSSDDTLSDSEVSEVSSEDGNLEFVSPLSTSHFSTNAFAFQRQAVELAC